MGTSEGGRKAAAKILARDPDFYKKIGARGGKRSSDGGFGSILVGKDGMTGRARARHWGSIGGKLSKRPKRAL